MGRNLIKTNTMNKIPTAKELLKVNYLLIEDGKTCEAHTHLVVKQMIKLTKLHVEAALKAQAKRITQIYDKFAQCETKEEFEDCRDIDLCAFVDDLAVDLAVEYPLSNIK